MSNNSSINRARSAPSRRGENSTGNSNNSYSTGMNQTRPLSSTTIDSKNVNNEHHHNNNNNLTSKIESTNNTNEIMNNDSNADSNYSGINTYDIINNSAIDSIHPRPRSGRTGNIANHYILTMIDIYFI